MLHPMLVELLENAPQKVWESYCANPCPTPLEVRFAARALHQLGRFAQARDLALQAQARGEATAVLEEAQSILDLGEIELAISRLEQVKTTNWSAVDRICHARQLGTMYDEVGNKNAAQHLELAWRGSFADEDYKHFRTGIAQSLGNHFSKIGASEKALYYFRLALENAAPYRKAYVLVQKARTEIYLGLYTEAKKSLYAAQAYLETTPAIQAMFYYESALLARAENRLEDAILAFRTALQISSERLEYEVVKYTLLGLVAAYTSQSNFEMARDHLLKAEKYGSDQKFLGLYSLRLGALLAAQKHKDAKKHLLLAQKKFGQSNMKKELGWAALYLTQVALQQRNMTTLKAHLQVVKDCISQFGLPSQQLELWGLPEVEKLLIDDQKPKTKPPKAKPELQLVTLGDQALYFNGKPIVFRLARSLEFLTYALLHRRFLLSQVFLDLFDGESANTIRGYVHQMRYELERLVPGVKIVLDKTTKYYTLKSKLPIVWDVEQLKNNMLLDSDGLAIISSYNGEFLSETEAPWVVTERCRLRRAVVDFATRYATSQTVLHRLLEIDPLNEMVAQELSKFKMN
jgi:tetratricopeptide (TPR) repeat protein